MKVTPVNAEAMIKLEQEKKVLQQKLNVSKGDVKNHQKIERELVNKNCDMLGRIAVLQSEVKVNESEENSQLKERILQLEGGGSKEIEKLNAKVIELEQEIEEHKKLAAELLREKKNGKDSVKENKGEVVNLKKQIVNLEKENNYVKSKLDLCSTKLERMELEVKREKDLNDILISQIKGGKVNMNQPPVENSPSPRERSVSVSVQNTSITIEGEYIDVEADICEKEYRMGHGKCTKNDCKENHDIDFTKRGVCTYEFEKKGSCKRGSECWFTHQIPRWYKTAPDTVNEMREKIKRMKNKNRVINNQKTSFPVWQMSNAASPQQSLQNVNSNGVYTGSQEYNLTPRRNSNEVKQKSPINSDFLEVLNNIVAETVKEHSRRW